MPQYLLSMYQPDGDPPPPEVLGPIMEKVGAWREDLQAAGAWVFTGGLYPASTATVVRTRRGDVVTTDGDQRARPGRRAGVGPAGRRDHRPALRGMANARQRGGSAQQPGGPAEHRRGLRRPCP